MAVASRPPSVFSACVADDWGPLLRQFLAQHSGVAGKAKAGFQIDEAGADQLRDLAVEVLHAFVFAGS